MSGKNLVLQLLCKMLSTNQSTVFFDYEYLWKKSPDTLDILHGDNLQGKEGSKATTFGCVWTSVPLTQEDCTIP